MMSPSSRSWPKVILVLALILFADGDLAALDFGSPPDPDLNQEQRVRAVLADYPARKGELLEGGPGQVVDILKGILELTQ